MLDLVSSLNLEACKASDGPNTSDRTPTTSLVNSPRAAGGIVGGGAAPFAAGFLGLLTRASTWSADSLLSLNDASRSNWPSGVRNWNALAGVSSLGGRT